MVGFAKKPETAANQKFAHENLDTALTTYQVDNIWVFSPSAKQVYKVSRDGHVNFDFPLDSSQIKAAFEKQPLAHFLRSHNSRHCRAKRSKLFTHQMIRSDYRQNKDTSLLGGFMIWAFANI
jgi:sensor domain CHASE-containing protein